MTWLSFDIDDAVTQNTRTRRLTVTIVNDCASSLGGNDWIVLVASYLVVQGRGNGGIVGTGGEP